VILNREGPEKKFDMVSRLIVLNFNFSSTPLSKSKLDKKEIIINIL
jgi:hypothetical protein